MKRIPGLILFLSFVATGCQNSGLLPVAQTSAPARPAVQVGKVIGKARTLSMFSGMSLAPSSSPTPASSPKNPYASPYIDVSVDDAFFEQHFIRPEKGMKWDYKLNMQMDKLYAMMLGSSAPPTSAAFPKLLETAVSYEVSSIAEGNARITLEGRHLAPAEFAGMLPPLKIEMSTPQKAPALLIGLPSQQDQAQILPPNVELPTIEVTFILDGTEDITVSAGTFKDAIRIALKTDLSKVTGLPLEFQGRLPQTEAYFWVTPEAGMVKRAEYFVSEKEKGGRVEYLVQELQSFKK